MAAGISQEICPPNWALKRRSQPVSPQRDPRAPKPPTLPDSLPVRRPKPLYPKIRLSRSLFCDPPIYGREALGNSSTAATHQPQATIIVSRASSDCVMRRPSAGGPANR